MSINPNPSADRPSRHAPFLSSPAEAESVVGLGVDILDLKNPSEGALGAWSYEGVQ
ncbi:MAG: hypothetical protein EB012_06160, partial [Gammaproteobacteria bacterium]|nr:hypothetical protein [Gammaproteobacteria bacterium]